MLKGALVGLGRLGRVHFKNLVALEQSLPFVRLTAICDIDPEKLAGNFKARTNVDTGTDSAFDLSPYRLCQDYDRLLATESLDFVVLVVPTDLHSSFAVKALSRGIHVFSEKPMAESSESALAMIQAQKKSGKCLMIGHCLRFWREYLYLAEVVQQHTYGEVNSAHFWRGGYQDHQKNPSYQNWILQKSRGGGGLYDQHIHDTDLILWLFGAPDGVFTRGKTVFPESAFDVMLTTYLYPDKVVTARDDTACKGVPFSYGYEVACEKATLRFEHGKLTVYPDHSDAFSPDLSSYTDKESAYENELCYFLRTIEAGGTIARATPLESFETIRLIEAEVRSAESGNPETM